MMPPIDYKNSVVLFSGGMDSTVSLFYRLAQAKREGGTVNVLTINYGQRHLNEVAFARMMVERIRGSDQYGYQLGDFFIHRLLMGDHRSSLLSGQSVSKYDSVQEAERASQNDNAFIPYRNLMFLVVAAQHAFKLGAGVITTGLRGGWPDCTEDFENNVSTMLHQAVPNFWVRIETPTHRSRKETLELAQSIPGCMEAMKFTLTCFEGTTPPCGRCLPCLKRAEGFAAIGIEDPITGPRYEAGMGPAQQ